MSSALAKKIAERICAIRDSEYTDDDSPGFAGIVDDMLLAGRLDSLLADAAPVVSEETRAALLDFSMRISEDERWTANYVSATAYVDCVKPEDRCKVAAELLALAGGAR